jgi:hypothetical protein
MMNHPTNDLSTTITTMVEPTANNKFYKSLCLTNTAEYSENEIEKVDSRENFSSSTTTTNPTSNTINNSLTTHSTGTTTSDYSKQWAETKVSYLRFIIPRNALKRWIINVIQQLSNVAWDHWDHRNSEFSAIPPPQPSLNALPTLLPSVMPSLRLSASPSEPSTAVSSVTSSHYGIQCNQP